MGRGFEFFTIGVTAAIGVGTSFYVLNPYLKEQQLHKQEQLARTAQSTPQDHSDRAGSRQVSETMFSTHANSSNSSAEIELDQQTTWESIRQFGAKTFEPGDLRQKWAKDNGKESDNK